MREKWESFPQEIFGPSESKWCFERLPAKSGWSVSCQLDGNPITGVLYIDNNDDDDDDDFGDHDNGDDHQINIFWPKIAVF